MSTVDIQIMKEANKCLYRLKHTITGWNNGYKQNRIMSHFDKIFIFELITKVIFMKLLVSFQYTT